VPSQHNGDFQTHHRASTVPRPLRRRRIVSQPSSAPSPPIFLEVLSRPAYFRSGSTAPVLSVAFVYPPGGGDWCSADGKHVAPGCRMQVEKLRFGGSNPAFSSNTDPTRLRVDGKVGPPWSLAATHLTTLKPGNVDKPADRTGQTGQPASQPASQQGQTRRPLRLGSLPVCQVLYAASPQGQPNNGLEHSFLAVLKLHLLALSHGFQSLPRLLCMCIPAFLLFLHFCRDLNVTEITAVLLDRAGRHRDPTLRIADSHSDHHRLRLAKSGSRHSSAENIAVIVQD
jgi:hypothetical protein